MTEGSTDTTSGNEPTKDELRVRLSKIEDYSKHYLADQLEQEHERREAAERRLDDLESEVAELREIVNSFAGPNSNQSPPEKRAADLRMAMVRAAKEDDLEETRWWKDEVKNALVAQNHTGLNKPDYYDAMEDAADHQGFSMATKPVTKDGRSWEAKAVKVVLDDLPSETSGRDSTTPGAGGAAAETEQTTTSTDPNTT